MSDTPNEELRKLMRTYAGFQTATALVVASKFGDVWCAGVIVSLFAISIPSSFAFASLARVTPEDEKRNPAPISSVCFVLAFLPSISAISLLLASASIFAAVIFPVTCFAWFMVIGSRHKKESERINPTEHDVK